MLAPVAGSAAPDTPAALLANLDGNSKNLAASLRSVMITFLPSPLYEDHSHWDKQKLVTNGLTWKSDGLLLKPHKQLKLENDGLWWRIKVTAPRLEDSLIVDIRDVERPSSDRMLFTAFFRLDAEVDYDRQRWESGVRLWSGGARARLRLQMTVRCEFTSRVEPNGTFFPDTVFRLRVVSSDVRYDHLEITHLAGVGGDLARILGDAALSTARQVKPSLERHLLDKANAAILKAGDSKEVRVSLSGLLGKLGRSAK
jgi:hypothetical protein